MVPMSCHIDYIWSHLVTPGHTWSQYALFVMVCYINDMRLHGYVFKGPVKLVDSLRYDKTCGY